MPTHNHDMIGRPSGNARRDRIIDYLRRTEGPSVREIGEAVGLNSSASIGRQLRVLRDRGVLEFDSDRQRTIRLTETRIPGVVDGRRGYWTLA